MKVIVKFLGGFLLVVLLAGFLSLSYFKTNTQSVVDAAVPDVGQIEPVGTGFGAAVCDRIIPIGEPLERMVNLLATVYEANQNTFYNVDMASKTLSSIYTNLNKNGKEVCDWKKCSPNFANLGPNFAIELDAVVKKWKVGGQVPLPVDKECTGSPCPILGNAQDADLAIKLGEDKKFDDQKKEIDKLSGISEIGTLIGLEWIIKRQEKTVQDLFDETNPTEVVPEDLAQGDAGTKISKTAMIQRMAARASAMIKDCTLSETEKKMALSGRIGDKYPMTCQAALENGQYWPLAWSEFCKSECAANQVGSDKCIECLRKPIFDFWGLKNVSTLARLNYEIYNQCARTLLIDDAGKPLKNEDGTYQSKDACHNSITGDWEISEACVECLCTNETTVDSDDAYSTAEDVIIRTRMTDNECLAWLCGGNSHNWTCCHQTPIDWSAFADGTEPEAQVHEIDSTATAFSQAFVVTSYTPPTFKLDKAQTSSGQMVGPGSMAVDRKVIPLGSCIKIKKINELDVKGRTWTTFPGMPSLNKILEDSPLYDMNFCANDVGDTTKPENIVGKRIDLWLPSWFQGKAWGRREVDIKWWYDPGNPCYKQDRPYAFCNSEPTSPYPGTVVRDGYIFAYGKDKQLDDASPALKTLLTCLKSKYPTGWVINSISDSGGYDHCANHWTNPTCYHAQNSCHYGGNLCKSIGSMAIDVSAKIGDNAEKLLAATCACAKENPELGKVTAAKEQDPLHYHISVKNDSCDCDGKGQRKDNDCLKK